MRDTTPEVAEVAVVGANRSSTHDRLPSIGQHVAHRVQLLVFTTYRVKDGFETNGGGPGETPWTHEMPEVEDSDEPDDGSDDGSGDDEGTAAS